MDDQAIVRRRAVFGATANQFKNRSFYSTLLAASGERQTGRLVNGLVNNRIPLYLTGSKLPSDCRPAIANRSDSVA